MKKTIAHFGRADCFIALLLFLGLACAEANDRVPGQGEGSVLRETDDVEAGWKWIVNETFGFALRVPASSHIEPSTPKERFEYIRIQNYNMDDAGEDLRPNTYWLDIYLFHHKGKVGEPRNRCPGEILNPNIETKDGLKVYTGDVEDEKGAAGGRIRGLCVETGALDISIHAAESKKNTPLVNRILKSFRFMPKPDKKQ